jgi:hypothetical protein
MIMIKCPKLLKYRIIKILYRIYRIKLKILNKSENKRELIDLLRLE